MMVRAKSPGDPGEVELRTRHQMVESTKQNPPPKIMHVGRTEHAWGCVLKFVPAFVVDLSLVCENSFESKFQPRRFESRYNQSILLDTSPRMAGTVQGHTKQKVNVHLQTNVTCTILAVIAPPPMVANAFPSALLACTALPPVLTDAFPSALLAVTATLHVLTIPPIPIRGGSGLRGRLRLVWRLLSVTKM